VINYPEKKKFIQGGAHMNYIGIDHHKQYSHMTVMDEEGSIVKAGRVLNLRAEVEDFLGAVKQGSGAVIEAGRSSYTMADLLGEMGVEVTIAHPQEVKSIAHAWIKTDKRASEILAHLLRTDMVPGVYRRGKENREAQRVLRQRAWYVAALTGVKNRIRVLLAQQREEAQQEASRFKKLFSREGLKFLKEVALPGTDKELLEALLKSYEHLEERIKESDELVKRVHQELREAQRIDTVPGFAEFLSVLVAVEIADIKRFSRVESLHSYAGVIPSTHSSGQRSYHGKIIKAGNRWLRWALVEAVWPAITVDHDLRVFYERLARRKGPNMAKVATARRLLTIIYKILKEGRAYVPYKRGGK